MVASAHCAKKTVRALAADALRRLASPPDREVAADELADFISGKSFQA